MDDNQNGSNETSQQDQIMEINDEDLQQLKPGIIKFNSIIETPADQDVNNTNSIDESNLPTINWMPSEELDLPTTSNLQVNNNTSQEQICEVQTPEENIPIPQVTIETIQKTIHTPPEIIPITHTCHVCQKGFPTARILHEHQQTHIVYDATITQTVRNHRRSIYTARNDQFTCDFPPVDATERPITVIRPYKCQYCSLTFRRKVQLRSHYQVHSTLTPYHCTRCTEQFRTANELRLHTRLQHQLIVGRQVLKCYVCDARFRSRAYYIQHLNQHVGQSQSKCLFCNRRITKRHLKKHIKSVHPNEPILRCDMCEAIFANQTMRIKHGMIFHPEMYQCYVDLQFSDDDKLFI